jgi:large subunit ribosomal protein L20
MPRVKNVAATRNRRKKILKLAKGYYGAKHLLYKTAKEQVMNSLAYQYRDRRRRKRDFRKLWITRINAAARINDLSYSKLINGLSLANIEVNRKMLADIAVNDQSGFKAICDQAKKALEKAAK